MVVGVVLPLQLLVDFVGFLLCVSEPPREPTRDVAVNAPALSPFTLDSCCPAELNAVGGVVCSLKKAEMICAKHAFVWRDPFVWRELGLGEGWDI